MSDELIKKIARTWAGIDGKMDDFDACASNPTQDYQDGIFSKYMMQADELLRRSGLGHEIYQLRCQKSAGSSALAL